MPDRRALAGVPPLLVGSAAAVAAETSAGLLLYSGEGIFQAVTLILAMETGSLAFGLWTGKLARRTRRVEQVRRRWVFVLLTFAAAAVLSVEWRFLNDAPAQGFRQGLGLAFLGCLPLFAVGALLASLGAVGPGGKSPYAGVGVPALLGAALGFLLGGLVLLPNAEPYTLYLFCLVVLSGAALMEGWVLDTTVLVETHERIRSEWGELRADTRSRGKPKGRVRVITEGARIRGAEGPRGEPARGWEGAALEWLTQLTPPPERLTYLGGGSGTLAREALRRLPHLQVEVVERGPQLVQLARACLHRWSGWSDLPVRYLPDFKAITPPLGDRVLLVIDSAVLPSLGETTLLRGEDWSFLAECVGEAGSVLIGGLPAGGDVISPVLGGLFEGAKGYFGSAALYVPVEDPDAELLSAEGTRADGAFLLLQRDPPEGGLPAFAGFRLWPVPEG